jgi:hypothetical protein
MKIMYPARLGADMKCPHCHTKITSIGGTLYACQNGHIVECVVLVTVNQTQQSAKPVENKPAEPRGPVKPTQVF